MVARPSSLVLGCGHHSRSWILGGCPFHHPAKDFVTVDKNPERKPDIVADIRDEDSLKHHLTDLYQNIIFEHLPYNVMSDLSKFKRLLQDNGYLIIINSGYQYLDTVAPSKIWICRNYKSPFNHVTVIIPKQGEHAGALPALNNAVVTYLMKYLSYKNKRALLDSLKTLHISDETRDLYQFSADHLWLNPNASRSMIHDESGHDMICDLLSKKCVHPPTKSEIMSMASTYTPGIFRKIFTDSHSDDMRNFLELLHGTQEFLGYGQLKNIAKTLKKRNSNAIFMTETTRVFIQIYARITTYFTYDLFKAHQSKLAYQACGLRKS